MQSHSFSDLGLSQGFLNAVVSQGYTKPTEVQARAIPVLLSGANLLATAQTGTGKTAAFTLPLLQRLLEERKQRGAPGHKNGSGRGPARPAALILAPTRELAIQIDTSLEEYGRGSGVSHLAIFGGAPKGRQLQGLRKNPAILAATPGRLLDFMGEGEIDLSGVRYFILDEADRMLDMGFIPDVRRIAKAVTGREQTSLFSATMPPEIEALSRELLGKAERIAVAPKAITADGIKQSVLHLAREAKIGFLPELIRERNMFRVLVFTRTKHRAKKVAKVLLKNGIPSDELHGNRTQNQRQRALENFRNGKVQVLVGTDVAARGIDVDDITHVINYEIPNEPETYVHRVGRTARAGSVGEAISLCDSEELSDFRQIERMLKREVEVDRLHPYHKEPAVAAVPRG
ncbi:MAG: DEAD/DEAH box helicase, partial [Alkalispirochaetaceae bacterium]